MKSLPIRAVIASAILALGACQVPAPAAKSAPAEFLVAPTSVHGNVEVTLRAKPRVHSGARVFYVPGVARNVGAADVGQCGITVGLYLQGTRVGTAYANSGKLGIGETWIFEAQGFFTPGLVPDEARVDRVTAFGGH